MAVIGWLRFICANGMVVGTATARMRQVHNTALDAKEIGATIRSGLANAAADLEQFKQWVQIPVSDELFRRWVDNELRKRWGVKAATRAYHIVNSCLLDLHRDAAHSVVWYSIRRVSVTRREASRISRDTRFPPSS